MSAERPNLLLVELAARTVLAHASLPSATGFGKSEGTAPPMTSCRC